MKQWLSGGIALILSLILLSGCSQESAASSQSEPKISYHEKVPADFVVDPDAPDIDLTAVDADQAYLTLCEIINAAEDHLGKTVKAHGELNIFHDDYLGKDIYALMVHDADGCSSQGIEFELADTSGSSATLHEGDHLTIVGAFTQYTENDSTLTLLRNTLILSQH